MKIFIGSDHAGFAAKQKLISKYSSMYTFIDQGTDSEERADYPDFADKVAHHVLSADPKEFIGILICGSGQGMAMRANKYPGIRAALCWDVESAELARAHNDANILCMGGRLLSFDTLCSVFETFMKITFEGGRHAHRVEKISAPLDC